jgi:3-hydroxyisobutyrate dehydrogenase-like beta-hydroxyacid dehydrogenase
MSETIGFIGTGGMGEPMALNLLKAGFPLRVYNRTPEKARPLAKQGAEIVGRPVDVVTEGGIVITMVANDAALEATTTGDDGLLQRFGPGNIYLVMSTVAPATALRFASLTAAHRATYVAAPVFGRPDASAAKQLQIVVAGPQAARTRVRPVLEALGQGIFELGNEPHLANVVKLCGNFMIVAALEAMAEAFTLAEKSGVPRETAYQVLTQTTFANPLYQNYGRMIAEHHYTPAGFQLTLGLKDMTLALGQADEAQMPMPLASLLHDRLTTQVAKGRQHLDWSALALGAAEDAGYRRKRDTGIATA